MPLLDNFRLWPPGAVPQGAGKWILVVATIVVLLLIILFASPASAPKMSQQPAAAPQSSAMNLASQNERFGEQLRRQQAELAQAMARERAARGLLEQPVGVAASGGAPADGFPQRSSDPYAPAPQQPPPDPVELERKKIALEDFKRDQRRAFASPLALSLREAYSAAQAPENPVMPPATADTAPVPAAPEPSGKFVIREGSFLETVLLNRLDSTFSGPVKVMVSNDFYTRDRQTILIPRGTEVLGEASHVEATGQKRMAVVFHRLIRPDDVAVDLDQFTGLNQIGETGLRDKVNNHYMQIFGVSIALGVIGAAAQGSASYGYGAGGWDTARAGFGTGASQAATQILNRFLNIPPTVTIREGHRVKVYFMKDIEVPAYRRL